MEGRAGGCDAEGLAGQLSPESLLLREGAVKRVVFEHVAERDDSFSNRVELTNGDVLAARIRSFDGEDLVVESPFAGEIRIPRELLKTLQLGIHQQEVIYEGPAGLEGWTPNGRDVDSWSSEDGVLRMAGGGSLSRELKLPQQFVVLFTLEWRNNPNFQFTFADPLLPTNSQCDRYVFRFAGNGIEVKRQASEGRRDTTIIPLYRTSELYPGNRLKVEIRVDRNNSMMQLFLNGEPEGRYNDPVPNVPTGNGISISSNSGGDGEHELSNIQVLSWNEESDRHRTEERGDVTMDSLIERRGDRYSGTLNSISPTGDRLAFSFKTDFLDTPVELPDTEISTIFFKSEENSRSTALNDSLVLRLQSDGFIHVSSCVFDGKRAKVTHPLLGELSFDRNGVLAVERKEVPIKATKP